MRLAYFIAWRYFFSKNKQHVINIISTIALIGIIICSAALVVVLSVFNGFEEQIKDSYKAINPDLKIEATEGKSFVPDSVLFAKIKTHGKVRYYSPTIEDNAILKYEERTQPARVLGIQSENLEAYAFEEILVGGNMYLEHNSRNFAVLGLGLSYDLGATLHSLSPIQVYTSRRGSKRSTSLTRSLHKEQVFASGIFGGDAEFSSQYIIVNYPFAQKLFAYKDEVSAIDITLHNPEEVTSVQKEFYKILGPGFSIKDRLQQNEMVFKMLKMEKFSIFSILTLILLVAAFNIMGSLSMIIIDKKEDIATLKSLGAPHKLIKRIFMLETLILSVVGAVVGVSLGLAICILQKKFKLIKLQSDNYITSYFPVEINYTDILIIFIIVVCIGFLISIIPIRHISKEIKLTNAH